MDKKYDHKKVEEKIYKMWEEKGHFKAEIDGDKKPYTILLPPPNASGKMHTGNVLMIAIEDLLIRMKRMQGYTALWIPGTDHAGFETQITFERELRKKGKSRFDFDRDSLYQEIWDFVHENRDMIDDQIKSMGASVDWSRYTFTLDDKVIKTVYKTFEKMLADDLIYRDDYMVNYCPECGTTFADLEVKHVERKTPLYYLKYGPFVLATTRPETKFGDTGVAVHPDDDRYKQYIGKEIEVVGLLGKFKVKVVADKSVDPEFGTGVVKVTLAHDKNDYEMGKRDGLEIKQVIGLDGRLNELTGKYSGMTVKEARTVVVEDLKKAGLLEKVDENYENVVSVCYKGGHTIEPTVLPNWFVRVDHGEKSLKKPALDAVLKGDTRIFPRWRKVTYTRWMEDMHDWPISRQVVWGIRIPAWYSVSENSDLLVTFLAKSKGVVKRSKGKVKEEAREGEVVSGKISELLKDYGFNEIEAGLQTMIAPKAAKYVVGADKPGDDYLQDTDTFDTWFSSGQWPLVTLGYPDGKDFNYFYPTSVLETGWEIIRPWVSRMIMFGLYLTGEVPFKDVYLHGLVRARDGRKMSKSLGNVINPEEYMEEYGVDALRMGLISGTAVGKDFNFPHDKVIAYRNFANKIWNMARFMVMMFERFEEDSGEKVGFFDDSVISRLTAEDRAVLKGLSELISEVNTAVDKYRFTDAGEAIYHFMWHEVADNYIELVKKREDKGVALSVLRHVYLNCLKLLHPFMPFVTEEIWQSLKRPDDEDLIVSKWPEPVVLD